MTIWATWLLQMFGYKKWEPREGFVLRMKFAAFHAAGAHGKPNYFGLLSTRSFDLASKLLLCKIVLEGLGASCLLCC